MYPLFVGYNLQELEEKIMMKKSMPAEYIGTFERENIPFYMLSGMFRMVYNAPCFADDGFNLVEVIPATWDVYALQ